MHFYAKPICFQEITMNSFLNAYDEIFLQYHLNVFGAFRQLLLNEMFFPQLPQKRNIFGIIVHFVHLKTCVLPAFKEWILIIFKMTLRLWNAISPSILALTSFFFLVDQEKSAKSEKVYPSPCSFPNSWIKEVV